MKECPTLKVLQGGIIGLLKLQERRIVVTIQEDQ
jgi:hypothetical protein